MPHVIWNTAPEEHEYPAAGNPHVAADLRSTDIPCRLAVAEGNTSTTETAR